MPACRRLFSNQRIGQRGWARLRATPLLQPTADNVLKAWPVSKQVNGPKNNGADLLEAVG